jgi:ABC-2 type transport system permease protein
MNVIYILWLRQIKKYLRSRSRLIGSLGQPILFLLALGYGLGAVFESAGQGSYFQFLAPGVIGMSILFSAIFSGIEIIWDKQFGYLKETLVSPVPRTTIMLGRTLGGATTAVVQGLLVFVITLFFGFRPASWPMVIVAFLFMFLVALFFTALGTAIASKLEDMQGFQLIMNFLVMPLFFLSGALFPITNLPKILDIIVHLNPLTYGIDGLRGALSGASHFGMLLDGSILAALTVVCLIIGTWLFSKIEI